MNKVCCFFVPPYILEALAHDRDQHVAATAAASLRAADAVRSHRFSREGLLPVPTRGDRDDGAGPYRIISDAEGDERTPGTTVRREGDAPSDDVEVDQAYDGLGDTWKFWMEAFGRDSLDGDGQALLGTVHYGRYYDNAFWDGTQMVFGDGDGVIFQPFTSSLDVIGHELAHGVTTSTADLEYRGQSGALNESVSDVFGSLVRQYTLGQDAASADWLIGADLLTATVRGRALRDMMHPGTAYDDPRLGKDPQPATMDGYVVTSSDNGGVHINSGIPNRAFALAATTIGGDAWAVAGQVWWDVLSGGSTTSDCDFITFATLTVAAATERYGADSAERAAVLAGWVEVGVLNEDGQAAAAASDAAADTLAALRSPTSGPSGATSVLVSRTGGFAGTTAARQVTLGELPRRQRDQWERLLATNTLVELPDHSDRPDSFCYQVSSPQLGLSTTVAEPELPDSVRTLLNETLRFG